MANSASSAGRSSAAEIKPADDMVFISGGLFTMGSDDHYSEEAPARTVRVDSFWIDKAPVTNDQFAAFVEATGWVTVAEIAPDPADYPGIRPDMIRAGSLVFQPPPGPVPMNDYSGWWEFCFGADWRHPLGPDSDIQELGTHPVVHIAYRDAEAYAEWAGKAIPSEAEWEFAARGGQDGAAYAWGDELAPDGKMMANYWQGQFPWQNLVLDGYERTSPVGSYPANPYGLYDMIGNIWEWTQDWFVEASLLRVGAPKSACCVPSNPRGGRESDSLDPCQPTIKVGRKALKGGSHLCAENYCRRYRPAARYAQPVDTSTSHVGFRCIRRVTP